MIDIINKVIIFEDGTEIESKFDGFDCKSIRFFEDFKNGMAVTFENLKEGDYSKFLTVLFNKLDCCQLDFRGYKIYKNRYSYERLSIPTCLTSSDSLKEEEVLDRLKEAWNLFTELERQHPDELDDFADGIHKCQYVLGMRIARDNKPDLFSKK